MSTICIIPARGGSQRIPLKNIKPFHGQPIIAYSIDKAKESGLFDRIIVSTDSDMILTVANQHGAQIHRRDNYYSKDSVGTQDVVANVLKELCVEDTDTVCCLYATSPLMDVRDLCKGYMLLTGYDGCKADYVMSVGYPPLQDAGQFYWGSAFCFLRGTPLVGTHTRMVHVDPDRVCDINTMEDWVRAEKLYEGIRK